MSAALDNARDEISDHLDAIKALFKPGVKVTLLVRTVSHADGSRDFLLTDDLLDEAIAAMLRRKHEGHRGPSATDRERE